MISNKQLAAIAAVAFGLILPLQAGTIKSSFIATQSYGHAPTSTLPSVTASVSISQRGKSVKEVVVNTTEIDGSETYRRTETFVPLGRYYFRRITDTDTVGGTTYTDDWTKGGNAKVKVKVPKGKGKRKKSKGGSLKLRFTDISTENNGTDTYTEETTTTINAKLGKRGKLSYSEVETEADNGVVDWSRTTTGQGKARGKIN